MLLTLAPMLLLVTMSLVMLGETLGLFPLTSSLLLQRVSAVCYAGSILWLIIFGVRGFLRDEERHQAERQARDELLREQHYELWQAHYLHEQAVQERTAVVLTALRTRPLSVRLRAILREPGR